jgi:hypothetical protein
MASKRAPATDKASPVYALYRKCVNWEAGEVLFDEPLLWFDTVAAVQAVYNASAEQARECVLNEFKIIRRSASLDFTSGYSWATIIFHFPRLPGEELHAAEVRIREDLREEEDTDIGARLLASVIASDGVHLEPTNNKGSPNVRPIDLSEELDEFADFIA